MKWSAYLAKAVQCFTWFAFDIGTGCLSSSLIRAWTTRTHRCFSVSVHARSFLPALRTTRTWTMSLSIMSAISERDELGRSSIDDEDCPNYEVAISRRWACSWIFPILPWYQTVSPPPVASFFFFSLFYHFHATDTTIKLKIQLTTNFFNQGIYLKGWQNFTDSCESQSPFLNYLFGYELYLLWVLDSWLA